MNEFIAPSTPEYDAFGPWVYPVTDEADMPPIFRGFMDLHDLQLVLKIPRDIERRYATPDMDLYDTLVYVDADGVGTLSRPPMSDYDPDLLPKPSWVAWSDLIGFEQTTSYLDGQVRLFCREASPIQFSFNAVSADIIDDLLSLIHYKLFPKKLASGYSTHLFRDAVGSNDVALRNYFNKLQKTIESLSPVFRRKTRRLNGNGALGEPSERLIPGKRLNAIILGTSGPDIVMVHRRLSGLEGSKNDPSVGFTVLRRDAVQVEASQNNKWMPIDDIRLPPSEVVIHAGQDDETFSTLWDLCETQVPMSTMAERSAPKLSHIEKKKVASKPVTGADKFRPPGQRPESLASGRDASKRGGNSEEGAVRGIDRYRPPGQAPTL